VAENWPAAQGGVTTQASAVAFQAYPTLHAQPDWPTSVLLVLYSAVVPQAWQAVSPSSEKVPAAQLAHTMSDVALQVELPS
jgi:hypothetical protein